MKFKFWIICTIWLLVTPSTIADPIKKALKVYQKQKYDVTEKVIRKVLAKDSLNSAAQYTYSLLYSNQKFGRYQIDSAHFFILAAIKNYKKLDEKQLTKMAKIPIGEKELYRQNKYVDSLAYNRAISVDTLGAYLYFIQHYPEAERLTDAIIRRDELAFQKAADTNTYQSYMAFMQLYPEALQVPEAQKRYDKLLFLDQVGGGKLSDYKRFIEAYPQSPYRSDAETQIFEISTADGSPSSYSNYLQDYANSSRTSQARNWLFHLLNHPLDSTWAQSNWMNDSLRVATSLDSIQLFPIFEDGKYGFAKQNGQLMIPAALDSLEERYLCGAISDDWLSVYQHGQAVYLTKNGKLIAKQHFDRVLDLGHGFLKVKKENGYSLWHKSGMPVLDSLYQDILLLKNRFVAFQQEELWGLSTLTGRVILSPLYESIKYEGPRITFKKEGLIAVVRPADLAASLNQVELSLDFRYEEIEVIDEDHLRGYSGDQEALISDSLNIPLDDHMIYESFHGWYAKTNQGINIFNSSLKDTLYQDLISTPRWLALKGKSQWQIYDSLLTPAVNLHFDSAAALGNQMFYLTKGDSAMLLFHNNRLLLLKSGDKITLWPDPNNIGMQPDDYILITGARNWRNIYNHDGESIYRTQYYDIRRISSSFFEIQRNGQKGLVDLSGKIVLRARYNGLDASSSGAISVFNRGRFGLFMTDKKFIRPQYQTKLIQLKENLWIAEKNKLKGVVDPQNKLALPIEYSEILIWNDSSVLAKKDRQWQLFDLQNKQSIMEGIDRFDWIRNDEEEKLIQVRNQDGYGILSNLKGEILSPAFDDIINLGTAGKPIYFTEKRVREADYYVVIYYDPNGRRLRKQVFEEKDYDKILCY